MSPLLFVLKYFAIGLWAFLVKLLVKSTTARSVALMRQILAISDSEGSLMHMPLLVI